MFDAIRDKRVRRLLFFGSVLLLIVTVVIRMFLGVEPAGAARTIAREFATSTAGAILLWLLGLIFVRIFVSVEDRARQTRVLDSEQSARSFQAAMRATDTWRHQGHIGRWVRETVVPEFLNRSSRSATPLEISSILLDPTDLEACRKHSDRRNSRHRRESAPFTTESIQVEIATTILAFAKAKHRSPHLSIKLFLTSDDIPFRVDVADNSGFITHEDQTAPAFMFDKESPFYATTCAYLRDFSSSGSRQVNLTPIAQTFESSRRADLCGALATAGIDFPPDRKSKIEKMLRKQLKRTGV